METLLKEILTKLEHLEKDIAEIKAQIHCFSENEEPERISKLELTQREKQLIRKKFDELAKKLGIENMKPIGAKKLRELMLADGIKPEDNEFSRGIIAMREE